MSCDYWRSYYYCNCMLSTTLHTSENVIILIQFDFLNKNYDYFHYTIHIVHIGRYTIVKMHDSMYNRPQFVWKIKNGTQRMLLSNSNFILIRHKFSFARYIYKQNIIWNNIYTQPWTIPYLLYMRYRKRLFFGISFWNTPQNITCTCNPKDDW